MSYKGTSRIKTLDMVDCNQLLDTARKAFASNKTKDVRFRKKQLKQLDLLLQENRDVICDALRADLHKPPYETNVCEISPTINEIADALYHIDEFVKPEKKATTILSMFDSVYVQKEPLGVCLILGAWNYPINLALGPLVGAMTAGNCVILKLPEGSPCTSGVLESLIPKYLDNECYQVLNCDLEATTHLIKNYRFDHIFYTGGEKGAKAIYMEASKNLTPVVLELGGKSPVYIDDDVRDVEAVWLRLFWGKFLNAGQTCIAPDYVLCSEKTQDSARKYFSKVLEKFYNNEADKSPDFARIVNQSHFDRLKKLIKESRLVIGGDLHPEKLLISPAIITDCSLDDAIMKEEIFGPILPFVTVKSVQEAINIINEREKPLALYVFSKSDKVADRFLKETSSGSVLVNDVILQVNSTSLPFGGVGNSGIGKYHGSYSFDTFSNSKAVVKRGFNSILEAIGAKRYPPYSDNNRWVIETLGRVRKSYFPGSILTGTFLFASGVASTMIFNSLFNSA